MKAPAGLAIGPLSTGNASLKNAVSPLCLSHGKCGVNRKLLVRNLSRLICYSGFSPGSDTLDSGDHNKDGAHAGMDGIEDLRCGAQ